MISPVTKRLTFEEFERLPDRPGKCELLEGELIELPPAKKKHNKIAKRVLFLLTAILDEAHARGECAGLGEAFQKMGYLFQNHSWLQPDASITHAGQTGEDYYLGAPALAVEVISESNTADQINRKIRLYLANGAAEVWILYPNTRQLWLYGREGKGQCYSGTFTSTLLPGATIGLHQILESL